MTLPTLIAQLTDTHVVGPDIDEELFVDNNARFALAVEAIAAESPAPDALVHTGDIAYGGAPAAYAIVADQVASLGLPFLPLPGNHDDRDELRRHFLAVPWIDAEHASWVVPVGGVRVIGLDTTTPGEHGGGFDAERERWLGDVFAETFSGRTVLAMHHPSFITGIEWMDRDGFPGRDRFAALIADAHRAGVIDRIACGHMHRPITSVVGGVIAQVGVPTVEAVELQLADRSRPLVIVDAAGYLVHRIDEAGIVSHTRYIDTGAVPIEPSWAHEYD